MVLRESVCLVSKIQKHQKVKDKKGLTEDRLSS